MFPILVIGKSKLFVSDTVVPAHFFLFQFIQQKQFYNKSSYTRKFETTITLKLRTSNRWRTHYKEDEKRENNQKKRNAFTIGLGEFEKDFYLKNEWWNQEYWRRKQN